MESLVPLLLVEDEPELRDALGEYLGACGFHVVAVGSALEALAVAAQAGPRILLTDLSLPDRRGDSFLEEFHRDRPECLLYIHSGDSNFVPNAHLRACGLTADHVFSKPSDLAKMVARFRADLTLL